MKMSKNFIKLNNYTFNGNDILSELNIDSVNTCINKCNDNLNCQGYTYDPIDQKCTLKNNITNLTYYPKKQAGYIDSMQWPLPIGAQVEPINDYELACDSDMYINEFSIDDSQNIKNIGITCINKKGDHIQKNYGNSNYSAGKLISNQDGFKSIIGSADTEKITGIAFRNFNNSINTNIFGTSSNVDQEYPCGNNGKINSITLSKNNDNINKIKEVKCLYYAPICTPEDCPELVSPWLLKKCDQPNCLDDTPSRCRIF